MEGDQRAGAGSAEAGFAIMRGVEARSRCFRYKEYKRLRDAEIFARNQLAIEKVDYGERLYIANVANHGFFIAHQHGAPMPRAIKVRPFVEVDDRAEELAYCDAGLLDLPGEIVVNSAHRAWSDLSRIMVSARNRGLLSTDDPRHPIVHEMGELAMHQSLGGDRFFPFGEGYLADERTFREMLSVGGPSWVQIVSRRAALNHSGFVAEVFTGLLLGRHDLREDPIVMAAFRQFGGDLLSRWIG